MNVARAWGLRLMRLCEPRAAAGTRDRVARVRVTDDFGAALLLCEPPLEWLPFASSGEARNVNARTAAATVRIGNGFPMGATAPAADHTHRRAVKRLQNGNSRVSPVTARAVMQEPQGSGSLNEGRFYEAGRPVPIRKQIAERIGGSALRCGNNDVDPVARGCRPTDRTVSTGPSRPNAGGAKNVMPRRERERQPR